MKKKDVMNNADCVRGTRIPYDMIDDLIQNHYPQLTLQQIVESINEDYRERFVMTKTNADIDII